MSFVVPPEYAQYYHLMEKLFLEKKSFKFPPGTSGTMVTRVINSCWSIFNCYQAVSIDHPKIQLHSNITIFNQAKMIFQDIFNDNEHDKTTAFLNRLRNENTTLQHIFSSALEKREEGLEEIPYLSIPVLSLDYPLFHPLSPDTEEDQQPTTKVWCFNTTSS